jgi:predicted PurR-regulated permease PerM
MTYKSLLRALRNLLVGSVLICIIYGCAMFIVLYQWPKDVVKTIGIVILFLALMSCGAILGHLIFFKSRKGND